MSTHDLEIDSRLSTSRSPDEMPIASSPEQAANEYVTNEYEHGPDDYMGDEQQPSKKRKRRALIHEFVTLEQTLSQIENDDLAAHLFDTHYLRRKRRRIQTDDNMSDPEEEIAEEDSSAESWRPKQSWAAWPLSPEDVPQEFEQWGAERRWSEGASRVRGVGQELDLTLIALISKQARRDFTLWRARHYAGEQCRRKISGQHEHQMGQSKGSPEGGSSHDTYPVDENISSQAMDPDSTSNPKMTADEGQPNIHLSVSRVRTELDHLLMALHYSRQNHVAPDADNSEVDIESPDESAQDFEPFTHRRGSISDGRTKRRSKERNRSKTRQMLFTRDWSEVLGCAAASGWDSAILQRTASRCSKLFDESMDFDFAHAPPFMILSSNQQTGQLDNVPASIKFVCPEEDCERHMEPSDDREEVHDHIRMTHHYEDPGPIKVQFQGDSQTISTNSSFPCLHPTCRQRQIDFPTGWRLTEHLRRKHGVRLKSRTNSDASTTSESELYGDVHVDGFLKPILGRAPRKGRSSSRSDGESSRNIERSESRSTDAMETDESSS